MTAFIDIAKQKECFYKVRLDAIERLSKVIFSYFYVRDVFWEVNFLVGLMVLWFVQKTTMMT
jgi:hypothetical protein